MLKLPDLHHWHPLSIPEIKTIFRKMEWILAGGYGLEQFVGKAYRPHGDIDILIRRTDQNQIFNCLPENAIFIAKEPGKLTPANQNEFLASPIQDIWILDEQQYAWRLQIMLFDVEYGYWVYKRHKDIRLPYQKIFLELDGTQVLKPEIQLLYKSKNIRPKDQLDFEMVFPKLSKQAKKWLQQALLLCYEDHNWLNY